MATEEEQKQEQADRDEYERIKPLVLAFLKRESMRIESESADIAADAHTIEEYNTDLENVDDYCDDNQTKEDVFKQYLADIQDAMGCCENVRDRADSELEMLDRVHDEIEDLMKEWDPKKEEAGEYDEKPAAAPDDKKDD